MSAEIFDNLIEIVKTANQLYAQDVDFFRTWDKSLKRHSKAESSRLLNMSKQLAQAAGAPFEDPNTYWNDVVHTFDLLIDKVDNCIFEKDQNKQRLSVNASFDDARPKKSQVPKAIAKPQLSTPVDNTLRPFKPLLRKKPHALVPLEKSLEKQKPDSDHALEYYGQPYSVEIESYEYPSCVYPDTQHIHEMSRHEGCFSDKKFGYIDTMTTLKEMIEVLRKQSEISVDVEHHHYRSFLGIVCLLQISTDQYDFVVDTLALRDDLEILNEVFCDPKILKVFHSASKDVLWLQRDLGIYVVSLFDTYFASKELGFPKYSLAYLLELFANFTPSKKYQLADWRIRPLPSEMIDYARGDTHFLLDIARQLRSMLVRNGKLGSVLASSRKVAGLRYEMPGYDVTDPDWLRFIRADHFTTREQTIVFSLFELRDRLARELDESPSYIMSKETICWLAKHKPLTEPELFDAPGSLEALQPHVSEILNLIKTACDDLNLLQHVANMTSLKYDLFSSKTICDVARNYRKNGFSIFARSNSRRITRPKGIYLGILDEEMAHQSSMYRHNGDTSAAPSEHLMSNSQNHHSAERADHQTRFKGNPDVFLIDQSRDREVKQEQVTDNVTSCETFNFDAAEPILGRETSFSRKRR